MYQSTRRQMPEGLRLHIRKGSHFRNSLHSLVPKGLYSNKAAKSTSVLGDFHNTCARASTTHSFKPRTHAKLRDRKTDTAKTMCRRIQSKFCKELFVKNAKLSIPVTVYFLACSVFSRSKKGNVIGE